MTVLWHRLVLLTAIAFGVAPTTPALAQVAPKKTAAQLEAERVLRAFNCALHNEESKFQLKRGERVQVATGGLIDHVAFPENTKDADLARLLPSVAKLPALKSLDLGACKDVTEKGLKSLKVLPKLEVLLLDGSPVNGQGLKELAAVKGLRWLDISGTQLNDGDMRELGNITSLSSLVVRGMPRLTANGIKIINNLNKIRYLDITIEKAPDEMAAALSQAKVLSALKVAPITNSEAVHLGKMEGLDTLDLSNEDQRFGFNDRKNPVQANFFNSLSDAGLDKLVGCLNLRSLDLSYVRLSGSSLGEFTKMKRLEELYLRGSAWSNAGVTKLATMPTLRVIDLRETSVTDRAMEDLADLPTLQRLYLAGLPLTDSGLQDLTRLRSLQVLDLSSTRVSCVRVRDMKNFSQLEHLHLAGTHITAASFPVLGSMKSLRFLNLIDNLPEVSSTTIVPLRSELPTCLIIASDPGLTGFGFGGQMFVGWPGALYYQFYVPEVKTSAPPVVKVQPSKPLPTTTVKLPPPPPQPPAPPPIRIVPVGGGGTSGKQ